MWGGSCGRDPMLDGTPCFGTNQADTLTGSLGANEIYGLGGPDIISGLGDGDYLSGGSGGDEVSGGAVADYILGAGGAGGDTIHVEGDQEYGFEDEVFCGPGEDVVILDANDIYHDCEF